MNYLIGESLTKVNREELKNSDKQFVVVLSSEEWKKECESFDMGIDIITDIDNSEIFTTKAEVNYDSLTG